MGHVVPVLALASVAMPVLLLVLAGWGVVALHRRRKLRMATLRASQAIADHQAALERERAQAALVAYFR